VWISFKETKGIESKDGLPSTHNHTRRRFRDLVADVEEHLHVNGPWLYKLADIYYEPGVTAAVENMTAEELSQSAT
jgi:hypothetical protein